MALSAATLALSQGCASIRTRKADARDLLAADARVLEGCYDCLLAAQATYARVAGARDRTNASTAVVRLFETEVLLALREKELALDWRSTVGRARALLPRLPAALDGRRLLDAVDATLPDASGVPPRSLDAMREARRPYATKVLGELEWLSRAPLRPAVREYVWRTLDCEFPQRPGMPRVTLDSLRRLRRPEDGAPPLIFYQFGICGGGDTLALQRVAAAVPGFVESAYFLGQAAVFVADETGGEEAGQLLAKAYARFPKSPGITFYLGWLGTLTGDCTSALRYYGETIATEPAHEQAHLQRVICLSNVRQDSAAIDAATRLIALETSSSGQAHYWRALSRLRLQALELSRADIEIAKAQTDSAINVLTLAGVIAYEQDDLTAAERDMRAARAKPNGQKVCRAAWYLGLIENRWSRWKEAATSFSDAMACYDEKIAEDRAMIRYLERNPRVRPAVRARRIAALEDDMAEQRQQYFAGAFNSATNSARAGDLPHAKVMLDVAAKDDRLAEQVAKLRAALAAMERIPPR